LETKISYTKQILIWAGLWFAQIFLFRALFNSSTGIKAGEILFEKTQYLRVSIFKWVPFSVGDIFYSIVIFLFLWWLIRLFYKSKRKKSLKNIFILINILSLGYFLFWGGLYSQKPMLTRAEIETPIPQEDLKTLAKIYLNKCIVTREKIPEKLFTIDSIENIEKEIIYRQKPVAEHFKKGQHLQWKWKPSIFSGILSYTGISGYYNPFTAEAQYNSQLPDTVIPFTLAHESAHQIGFAREEEANFIAFLTAQNSHQPELIYSSDWTVLRMLLSRLKWEEEDFVQEILLSFSDKMKEDYHQEQQFYEQHAGKVANFFYMTNDLFLKSNQQDGAINYQYFLKLLWKYEKGLHNKDASPKTQMMKKN